MNGTGLLQALMAVPEPSGTSGNVIDLGADAWQVPLHDVSIIQAAVRQWPLYKFPTPAVRKKVAELIVQQAGRQAILSACMAILRG